jgi:nucleoside-diphosphate-sugar epimerase
MHVVITGGAGFIGKKLAGALLARGTLETASGRQAIEKLTLFDMMRAEGMPDDARITSLAGDITDLAAVHQAIRDDVGAVFHLAAIVSANAEEDFDLGMRVNLEGTRNVLEACRALPQPARLVFASSVALYGGDMPDVLDDGTILTPQTSYGAQKAIGELLLNDYSRKGFVDGRALRLPTIVVRPGRPNRAASTFASSIIREPLAGQEAVLPVAEDVRHWHASPRSAVGFLIHAATMDTGELGARRNLTMPGIAATVAEQIAALRRVAGDKVAARIRREPDPAIIKIVDGWPRNFDASRAESLGFKAEKSFDDIVRAHIDDELGGNWVH